MNFGIDKTLNICMEYAIMMRKVLLLLLIGGCLLAIATVYGDYTPHKSALAPHRDGKSLLETHNEYIGIRLDSHSGQFNIGTYPGGKTLTYNYGGRPGTEAPWSSWTVFKVDGDLYTNYIDHRNVDNYVAPD